MLDMAPLKSYMHFWWLSRHCDGFGEIDIQCWVWSSFELQKYPASPLSHLNALKVALWHRERTLLLTFRCTECTCCGQGKIPLLFYVPFRVFVSNIHSHYWYLPCFSRLFLTWKNTNKGKDFKQMDKVPSKTPFGWGGPQWTWTPRIRWRGGCCEWRHSPEGPGSPAHRIALRVGLEEGGR